MSGIILMEKTALYLRLSKEDIDKDEDSYSNSINNQKNILIDYASKHNYDIYDIYIDDDFSGLFLERPSLLRLMEDATKGLFSVVLAKSQSRLSRNMKHAEYLMNDFFPGNGIRFIGVTDGVDSSIKSNKKSRQINALINEWYSEDLSDNIRAVYQRKMRDGEYLGAYAPYGYRKSNKDKHHLEIDSEAAKWVRNIYLWYMEGKSVGEIILLLQHNRVATPLEYRKGIVTSYTRWSESTVKKILNNKMYTGCVIQGKSRRKSFKDATVIHNPKSSWIVVDKMHEPVISEKDFETVQSLKRKR